MAPGYDGSVRIDSRIDSKGFNKGIKGMIGSLGKLAAAVGLAFGVAAVVNFGRSAVQAASEMASALTGLQSILDGQGRSFSQAQKFIEDYTADGLVPATNAIAAYKNLALRGYDDSQIIGIMNALKDSAAFARTSSYTMGEAIAMASEGLKNENSILVDNAGVTKNVAQMWADYARTLGTTAGALTLAQKRQAEYNGIMYETRFQTGDAAKLAGGYAGQVAALGTSFLNLRVAVGNAIIPILNQIIPYVKAAIDWLVVLFNTVARVVNLLFQTNVGMIDLEETATDVGSGLGGAADEAEDLADSTGDAEKAAKGALAAFDELNVLQMDEDTGGGGGTTAPALIDVGGGEGGEDDPTTVFDEWAEKIAAFKETLLGLLEPAIEAFGRLKEALIPLGETIWSGLKWAWDNILVPLGTWVITEQLPAFLDLLAAAVTVLNTVLTALKPLGLWFWETFLKPLAEWTGGAIIDILEWLTARLYDLSDWITNHQATFEAMVVVFIAFKIALWALAAAGVMITSTVGLIALAIAGLIAIIILVVKNWDKIKETALLVWTVIKQVWGIVADWFLANVWEPVSEFAKEAWETISELAGMAWTIIKQVWGIVSSWFKVSVIDPVSNWFKTAWEDIVGFFTGAWDKVEEVWGKVATWFQENIIDPIKRGWEAFTEGLKTGWENTWNGIRDIVRTVINTIIGFINGMIQGVVNGINSIIGALNSISIDIPDWVPVFGGETWGMNLATISAPQIPLLATGAVIPPNAAFLAVLGDQKSGRNIEAPEALIRQIIQEEIGTQETAIKVSFEGTLGALVRELQPHITRETRRVGRSLAGGMA